MTIYMQSAVRPLEAAPMTEAERKARVELAAAYRIFAMLGWVEMIFNHITVRVPGPEHHFLINPFGLHYSEITASSLLLIDSTWNMTGNSNVTNLTNDPSVINFSPPVGDPTLLSSYKTLTVNNYNPHLC